MKKDVIRYFMMGLLLAGGCGESTPPADGEDSQASDKADSAGSTKVIGSVTETDLVADVTGVAGATDANLLNPWGIAFNSMGGAWISDNHSGLTTVYDSTGALKLTVTIPAPMGATDPAAPSGQVANNVATDFGGDKFIFVTEDGTVSGWQPSTGAVLHVDNSSKSSNYKGVAIAQSSSGARLFAAAFGTGTVDVLDNKYQPVTCEGGFVDPNMAKGYAPFNIYSNGSVLLVSYARQDSEKGDDQAGAGHGFIDAFDTEGFFIQRVASRGVLNSPWGIAVAPASWGKLAGALLVGNFGDGRINAWKMPSFSGYGSGATATRLGTIAGTNGKPLTIQNLWAVVFAPDAGGANSSQLYFTAGTGGEEHGLFGRIQIAQ